MEHDTNSGLIAYIARHPIAANLLMLLLLLFGAFATFKINREFFPEIEVSIINVTIRWPGASAGDVDKNILQLVEPELRFTANLKKMTSYAREGAASIRLEFLEGSDLRKAIEDTDQAVNSITSLPVDSEKPLITAPERFNNVANLLLSGPFSEQALKEFAKKIRDDLIDRGIAKVEFVGFRASEYLVEITPAKLRQLELGIADIARRVRQNTSELPSGTLDSGYEQQVRAVRNIDNPQSLGDVSVKNFASGEQITLDDIARLERIYDDNQIIGYSHGAPAIYLTLSRAENGDTLAADAVIDEYLAEIRPQLPPSLTLTKFGDRAKLLNGRIKLLLKNGLSGLAIVILVLFLFLNSRIALWVACGIPIAMLATIGVMLTMGETINMISLFALIMMLGVIVDDAIVVGEQTATYHEGGQAPADAAIQGAQRMVKPVLAASLTTIAAFLPIFVIKGVMGQIMSVLPLVVVAVVCASILECFFILPGHLRESLGRLPRWSWGRVVALSAVPALIFIVLLSRGENLGSDFNSVTGSLRAWRGNQNPMPFDIAVLALCFCLAVGLEAILLARRQRRHLAVSGRFRRWFDHGFAGFRDGVFSRIIGYALSWRYVTVAVMVSLLILAVGLVSGGRVPFVFFPSPEAEEVTARLYFNAGIAKEHTIAAVTRIEGALYDVEENLAGESGENIIVATFARIGASGFSRADNVAQIDARLTPSETRSLRTKQIIQAWIDAVPQIAGLKRVAISGRRGGPPGRDIEIYLQSAPPERLKAASLELQEVLSGYPGVFAASDDLPWGKPEIIMKLKERGKILGFTLDDVSRQVRNILEGAIARRFAEGDEQVAIRVRQQNTRRADMLYNLDLRSPSGSYVPIDEIVDFSVQQGFSAIQRLDGRANLTVTANVDTKVNSSAKILADLEAEALPRIVEKYGAAYRLAGRAQEQSETFGDLRYGAIAALISIYLILAGIFRSYAKPLAVMSIIPFGIVGAIFGHYIMGFSLTILSLIGLLGLSGILVNNSIILMSRYEERIRSGETVEEAAVGASRDRLRAVLLTSLTTIGGLVPLLFETSLQAQFLIPMALTIVFGLASATFLVLFLVPSLMAIGQDIHAVFSAHGQDPAPLAIQQRALSLSAKPALLGGSKGAAPKDHHSGPNSPVA